MCKNLQTHLCLCYATCMSEVVFWRCGLSTEINWVIMTTLKSKIFYLKLEGTHIQKLCTFNISPQGAHMEKYEFGRIFNFKECKKTHSSSTHHMPYPLFKNILFHEMHPWTEVLLPSILHICCDQEWQLFTVCCHVQDNAGA